MKKIVLTAITAAIMYIPSVCLSSYLIELESGGEFVTDQYWEEDNHIKFYSYGGLVDLPKKEIRSITDSNLDVPKETVTETKSSNHSESNTRTAVSPAPDSQDVNEQASVALTDDNSTAEEPQAEAVAKANTKKENSATDSNQQLMAELKSRLRNTLSELKDATRNKDTEGKKIARKKIREISDQIYDLKEKMKQ